jgi:iron-sulfur cluster repair protein YtfE (RIC family)
MLSTPKSLEEEHKEIMQSLLRASALTDETGEGVRELLKTLQPHFQKEERYAMPVLGSLTELVSGEKISNLSEIADSQAGLLREYESMFQEHETLRRFIERAEEQAKRERHEEVTEMLEALAHHARIEEEVLYPAALLAGTLAKVLLPSRAEVAIS